MLSERLEKVVVVLSILFGVVFGIGKLMKFCWCFEVLVLIDICGLSGVLLMWVWVSVFLKLVVVVVRFGLFVSVVLIMVLSLVLLNFFY